MYAAPRVDIPELLVVRKQFIAKYGKKFHENAMSNAGGILNERVVTKLSVQPPAAYLVQTYLEQICEKFEVDWSPTTRLSATQMGEPMAPPSGFSVPIGQGTGLGHIAHTGMTVNGDDEITYDGGQSLPPPLAPGASSAKSDFSEENYHLPSPPGASNPPPMVPPPAPGTTTSNGTTNKDDDDDDDEIDNGEAGESSQPQQQRHREADTDEEAVATAVGVAVAENHPKPLVEGEHAREGAVDANNKDNDNNNKDNNKDNNKGIDLQTIKRSQQPTPTSTLCCTSQRSSSVRTLARRHTIPDETQHPSQQPVRNKKEGVNLARVRFQRSCHRCYWTPRVGRRASLFASLDCQHSSSKHLHHRVSERSPSTRFFFVKFL
mmetsp:Transcript_4022/g.11502  ORF Transcript_4022/g.11502 Transcript_4022/m.11502 type:complete len:377 (+) Transcript_4022:777-1907(+)